VKRTATIRGELWVTLEAAADCYEVEVTWVREVYELGLLGPGEQVGSSTAIAAMELDHLARALRLHRQQGLELTAIVALW
jgi:hypothetical protein